MPKLHPVALSVICALAITGCASPMHKQPNRPLAVAPVLNVNHGVSANGLVRLGRYFEGQRRYAQAINAYRQAIQRDPLMVEAYTGLGMSLAGEQRYDEAVRQFQAAIVLEPQAAHLHNNLGYAYLLSGQMGEAVKALEEAQRLDPRHARSAENLRIAQAKVGNPAPERASPPATPAVQAIPAPVPGARLVEVSPQVFELNLPPKPRNQEKIHAVALPPVPPQQLRGIPARSFKLEVSNGNGILGLAKRVAERLTSAGVSTARLTNQRPFSHPTTELQYRDGYAAEAAALAAKLQHPVQLTRSERLASHIHVRLVLGRDVSSDVALVAPPAPAAPTKIAAR